MGDQRSAEIDLALDIEAGIFQNGRVHFRQNTAR
jgi:hypothetical protein